MVVKRITQSHFFQLNASCSVFEFLLISHIFHLFNGRYLRLSPIHFQTAEKTGLETSSSVGKGNDACEQEVTNHILHILLPLE